MIDPSVTMARLFRTLMVELLPHDSAHAGVGACRLCHQTLRFFGLALEHAAQQSLCNEPRLARPTRSAPRHELKLGFPYFSSGKPQRYEDDGTYADRLAKLQNRVEYNFPHPLSEVVTSLIDAGLRIDFLHEFPFANYKFLPFMKEAADGTYRLTKGEGTIPLLYSIRALKQP